MSPEASMVMVSRSVVHEAASAPSTKAAAQAGVRRGNKAGGCERARPCIGETCIRRA
ncbi:MAG: hypothetical protein AMXMBFR64_00330 [Myxococcales bacterium]